MVIEGVISGFSEIWKERPALGALQRSEQLMGFPCMMEATPELCLH